MNEPRLVALQGYRSSCCVDLVLCYDDKPAQGYCNTCKKLVNVSWPEQEQYLRLNEPGRRDIVSEVKSMLDCSQEIAENFDPVHKPKHYNSHPSGIQCIEITRHMSFNIGNAIKYLWRADEKENPIQDLEKALWYINDEINMRKK
jgi:hypothetical protein